VKLKKASAEELGILGRLLGWFGPNWRKFKKKKGEGKLTPWTSRDIRND
jgi:hypothetical protein